MKINSEQEMIDFGRQVAEGLINPGRVTSLGGPPKMHVPFLGEKRRQALPSIIELIGDVGAGKTTFVRGLAQGLGITENITSPSFTISKSYATPDGRTLTHYDFYRLPDPGLMSDDLGESINDRNTITVVEWADSVENILPENRLKITINYNNDNTREVNIL